MNETCENPHCRNPAPKQVPVSAEGQSSQRRALCSTCEEAYAWGVQHGQMSVTMPRIGEFLADGGFVVQAMNHGDTSPHGPFEAWAYEGPLDFDLATPQLFGLGRYAVEALRSLNDLLVSQGRQAPTGKPSPLIVDRRELATILAALRFHQAENVSADGQVADEGIRDIATDGAELVSLDPLEIDRLCERLNCGRPGLVISPPHEDRGDEPLFRVLYVIDVNGQDAQEAAEYAHRIMTDPNSGPPVLQVIDHTGQAETFDLAESDTGTGEGGRP